MNSFPVLKKHKLNNDNDNNNDNNNYDDDHILDDIIGYDKEKEEEEDLNIIIDNELKNKLKKDLEDLINTFIKQNTIENNKKIKNLKKEIDFLKKENEKLKKKFYDLQIILNK